MGERVFVTKIIPEKNQVVIGGPQDVFTDRLTADHINFMAVSEIKGDVRAVAKIRYSHKGAPCTVHMLNEEVIECIFDEPVRAVTPGQAVVLYDDEYVIGGGIIR
jgi:tRNA-specific 2-thiouridylase